MINEKFERIEHDDREKWLWCGPAVICAYTGIKSSDVYDALKYVRGKTSAVKGVYFDELNAAMKMLGWAVAKDLTPKIKTSLLDFSKINKEPTIVMVPEHFVMTENEFMVDSMNHNPVRVESNKYAKSPVWEAYTYKKVGAPKLVKRMITDKDNANSVMEKAKKIAKEFGIEIERDGNKWIVSRLDKRFGNWVDKELYSQDQVYKYIISVTE